MSTTAHEMHQNIDVQYPLTEGQAKRFGIKKPEIRFDSQGDLSNEERVERAMLNFVKDFGFVSATYMESCIRCGHCAEACHFYVQTEDPQYTPIWKLEPFKQAYKREYSPFSWFYKMLNLRRKVTADELQSWQHLLFESCTMCGRCTISCPMGIDIATLVAQARHAMFHAGLVPHELWAVAERAQREGSPLGAKPSVFEDRVEWMEDEHEVDLPMNKNKADVLVTMSSIEIQKYPESMAAIGKVLNQVGDDWTFHSEGYEATNFGLFSGNAQWQRDMSMKIIDTGIRLGVHTVVLPECGHAYGALRWQGANMYGKPLPFRVIHISEYLAELVENGRLKLKPVHNKSVTFHDPCQVSRRGGATQAPRKVIEALGLELRETEDSGDMNWCCGGGGGVITLNRADDIRYKTFEIKMEQMDETGAQMVMTSCSNCRQSFDDGQEHFKWDKTMQSLLEWAADRMIEE